MRRVVAEQWACEAATGAHFVQQAAAEIHQMLTRDTQGRGERRAPFYDIPGETLVADADQAQLDDGGAIARIYRQIIQQRRFLPGTDALQLLSGNPVAVSGQVGIVAPGYGCLG